MALRLKTRCLAKAAMSDCWVVSEKRSLGRISTYDQRYNVKCPVCEQIKLESVIKAFENTVRPCSFETRQYLHVRYQLYQC